jgi:hypothetical protein
MNTWNLEPTQILGPNKASLLERGIFFHINAKEVKRSTDSEKKGNRQAACPL